METKQKNIRSQNIKSQNISKNNVKIVEALKNISWTDEQFNQWLRYITSFLA